jgi:hypothetical protein
MKSIAHLSRRLAAALLCLGGLQATAGAADTGPALLPIRSGDLLGLIDARGRVVLPAEFEELKIGDPLILVRGAPHGLRLPGQDGGAAAGPGASPSAPAGPHRRTQGNRAGYADPQAAVALPPGTMPSPSPTAGRGGPGDAWGGYGAIDRTGRLVVRAVHDKLLRPGGGLVRSESRERTHRVFNAQGRDITPEGVDFVGIAADGMVRIWSGRKQGFMTVAGELAVPPRYEQASDFREGRARIWVDGKFGFIDRKGRIAMPARWDSAEDFSDGLAQVKADGQAASSTRRPWCWNPADRVPFSEGPPCQDRQPARLHRQAGAGLSSRRVQLRTGFPARLAQTTCRAAWQVYVGRDGQGGAGRQPTLAPRGRLGISAGRQKYRMQSGDLEALSAGLLRCSVRARNRWSVAARLRQPRAPVQVSTVGR